MGGESTVTVTGHGLGGRNQHLALAAGLLLAAQPDITILSAGTDGTDGPTDAAGAVTDCELMLSAAAQGLDAAHYLHQHDAYHFFEKAGGLIKTGPTQTNVMDIMLAIIS
jgi:hydroxypyruvate reductase